MNWMTESGGYTEQHPMWKDAYRYEILKQAGLKEKDELGGLETLGDLVKRYHEEFPNEQKDSLKEFTIWNMEQVYKKNKILNTKQRLRKRLTDMKRERPAKYHELVEKIIRNYVEYLNDSEDHEDDENANESADDAQPEYRISYKQPSVKSPRPLSN